MYIAVELPSNGGECLRKQDTREQSTQAAPHREYEPAGRRTRSLQHPPSASHLRFPHPHPRQRAIRRRGAAEIVLAPRPQRTALSPRAPPPAARSIYAPPPPATMPHIPITPAHHPETWPGREKTPSAAQRERSRAQRTADMTRIAGSRNAPTAPPLRSLKSWNMTRAPRAEQRSKTSWEGRCGMGERAQGRAHREAVVVWWGRRMVMVGLNAAACDDSAGGLLRSGGRNAPSQRQGLARRETVVVACRREGDGGIGEYMPPTITPTARSEIRGAGMDGDRAADATICRRSRVGARIARGEEPGAACALRLAPVSGGGGRIQKRSSWHVSRVGMSGLNSGPTVPARSSTTHGLRASSAHGLRAARSAGGGPTGKDAASIVKDVFLQSGRSGKFA
ncbi:hypothetical protein C8J57DRAFT_1265288 [Mycena rebaudengoi]|nr:hypothetical protein C8J57DRAFT_1265288 [Mycena rebaudengoi]